MKIPSYHIANEWKICGFFGEYRFLSNFSKAKVLFEGEFYPTSEHAYQAAKTNNEHEREKVLRHPLKGLKKMGRILTLREDWDEIKLSVMEQILKDKFNRNEDFKNLLIATGARYLEETNHWNDKFWGVCCKSNEGNNNLGKILMRVRGDLIEKAASCF